MRRPDLPRADRALLASLSGLFAVGLVASALFPGVEQVLNAVAIAVTVGVVAGWVVFHLVGELRLALEVHRPARESWPGWRTVLEQDIRVQAAPGSRAAQAPAGETR